MAAVSFVRIIRVGDVRVKIRWHVWVVFLFQLIWLSFSFHFPCDKSVIISRSDYFKAYLGKNETTQDSQRDLISLHKSVSTLSGATSISSTLLLLLTTFPVELNNLPSHLTAAVIIKIAEPIQTASARWGDLNFKQPSRKPRLITTSCQLVQEIIF